MGGKPSPIAEGGAAERPPWDRAAPGQAQAGPCAAAADAHQPGWLLLVTDHTLPLPPQLLGVAIRFGKFSVKENKQLEKNVQEFLSLSGIESADKLLYTDRYPEEKAVITDLKRKHAFRLHIGERAAAPLPAPTTVLPHGARSARGACRAWRRARAARVPDAAGTGFPAAACVGGWACARASQRWCFADFGKNEAPAPALLLLGITVV